MAGRRVLGFYGLTRHYTSGGACKWDEALVAGGTASAESVPTPVLRVTASQLRLALLHAAPGLAAPTQSRECRRGARKPITARLDAFPHHGRQSPRSPADWPGARAPRTSEHSGFWDPAADSFGAPEPGWARVSPTWLCTVCPPSPPRLRRRGSLEAGSKPL